MAALLMCATADGQRRGRMLMATPVSGAAATHSMSLTIDHTKCGSTDDSYVPVHVEVSGVLLKTKTNSGYVNRTDGNDIEFFSDAGLTTLLNWYVVKYDGSAGALEAVVSVPTVSHTTDTKFYMQVGSTSITTFQGGSTGQVYTNDGNYVAAYELKDGTTLDATDYTANALNGTINGATATTGVLDGAANFSGTNQYIDMGSGAATHWAGNVTLECWVFPTVSNVYQALIDNEDGSTGKRNYGYFLSASGTSSIYVSIGNPTFADIVATVSPGWTVNAWNHIVLTANGTNVNIYINGVQSFTTANTAVVTNTASRELLLGISAFSSQFPLHGKMDNATISKTARSIDWAIKRYNNGNNPGNIGSPGFIAYGSWTTP